MKQEMLLVQSLSGYVTALLGTTPVIFGDSSEPAGHVVMIVNFLRNGSPSVQYVMNSHLPTTKESCKKSMEDLLKKLSIDSEKFVVTGEVGTLHEEGVLTITRVY